MSYSIAVNNQVAVLHRAGNLAGTGTVTGIAGTITTALLDPTGASSAVSVTVTEVGTTGLYSITFTPTSTGNWLLTVTNPSGTDQKVERYVVDAKSISAIQADSSLALTTLARVKERWEPGELVGTSADSVLTSFISEASDEAHKKMSRILPEQTYTHYFDGDGTSRLTLAQGPLVSITGVWEIEYSDDGAGARVETATAVNAADRLEGGLRSEGHIGFGWVDLINGRFIAGRRNYKVTYVAGFDTIPERIVGAVTNRVVEFFNTRVARGTETGAGAAGDLQPIPVTVSERAFEWALKPFSQGGIA